MRPLGHAILSLLAFTVEALNGAAEKLNDVGDALSAVVDDLPTEGGGGSHTEPVIPQLPPVLPTLRAGDTSEEYAERFPPGLPCTIPAGLKYDPWKEVEVNGV